MPTLSMQRRVILIGIAGPSGCGKTTYAKHLIDHLRSPFGPIQLDEFFSRWNYIKHPVLGHIQSAEEPDTLDIERYLALLCQIKYEPETVMKYRRATIPIDNDQDIFVVAEGFLLFALSDAITNMFDIRLFLDSTQERCRMQRFRRRMRVKETVPNEQVTVAEQFREWFDHLVWAEYLKRRDLQMAKAEKIFQSEDYDIRQYSLLDAYVDKRLKELTDHEKDNF